MRALVFYHCGLCSNQGLGIEGGGGGSVEIDTICGFNVLLIFLPWSKRTKQTLSNESFEILRALFNC